ncbi:MAG: hypothetical protein NC489_32740 [Ruminococcus flavefaciens]|nr:hypothetical protein [Ruminococcus flavefaciens]
MTEKELIQAAKRYLNKVQQTDRLIARLKSTIATLRAGLTSQSYELKPDKVQSSGPTDTLAETFARIDELEREINQNISDLSDWKKEAFERIGRVADLDQRNVLLARYVEGKKWEQVAVEINLSIRQVTRIHGGALMSFAGCNEDVLECPTGS